MFKFIAKIFGIHVHEFNSWEVFEEGKLYKFHLAMGSYLVQKRTCKICGYTQIKTEKC